MKLLSSLAVALTVLLSPTLVFAHGGGLDAYGCHHNRKAGGYHCHRGVLAGQSFGSKEEMIAVLNKEKSNANTQQTEGGKQQ